MRQHSETAWNIASLYCNVLASETRDLAAHIDVALANERSRVGQLIATIKIAHQYLEDGNVGRAQAALQDAIECSLMDERKS